MSNKTTRKPAQSKGFREEAAQSAVTGVLVQQVCQSGPSAVAYVAQKQRLIHHRKTHPISAAIRLRYLHQMMRRWAASTRFIAGNCPGVGAYPVEW
jgi:hypothetical protein